MGVDSTKLDTLLVQVTFLNKDFTVKEVDSEANPMILTFGLILSATED
jgi:hypothetical protein